jgi:hypothetical protein
MTLTEQLTDYVNAAFSGLYVQSSEPDEAEREIAALARQHDWTIAAWDLAGGLRFPNGPHSPTTDLGTGDPLAVLRAVPSLASSAGTTLILLHNFHKFLSNPEVVQTTFTQLVAGKQQRTFLVVLAPVVQIPVELEKLFVVLEHSLPDRQQLERIARELTADQPEDMPQGDDLQRVLDAAAGLTRYESEGAFALSLTRHNAPAGEHLGDEGPGAEEEQPADPAPRRGALRRAGRPEQPQGLLPPGPAAWATRQAAWHSPAGRSRRRKVGIRPLPR